MPGYWQDPSRWKACHHWQWPAAVLAVVLVVIAFFPVWQPASLENSNTAAVTSVADHGKAPSAVYELAGFLPASQESGPPRNVIQQRVVLPEDTADSFRGGLCLHNRPPPDLI